MQRLQMEVYRMDHPDGTPRKYWCYHYASGTLTTRWGGANRALQENIKSCASSEIWKLVSEKEGKGYRRMPGPWWIDDKGIDWNGTVNNAPVQQQPVPAPQPAPPAPAKFSDVLLNWTASDLDGDWQKGIQDALEPVVSDGRVVVQVEKNRLVVTADGAMLDVLVRNKRSRGTIPKGKSAWLIALCLLKLSKHLAMTVVDDDTNVIDRRYLSSKIDTLGVPIEVFDEVAEKLGLIVSKAFVKANPVLANFF